MKALRPLIAAILVAFCLAPLSSQAADQKADKPKSSEKLKPYPLKTCIISGDKLGEMGDPFVYAYKGREIKFCCKGCLKDFNKDPAKYLKLIDETAAKANKAKSQTPPGPAPAPK
jgi:YHS domain-containing protein